MDKLTKEKVKEISIYIEKNFGIKRTNATYSTYTNEFCILIGNNPEINKKIIGCYSPFFNEIGINEEYYENNKKKHGEKEAFLLLVEAISHEMIHAELCFNGKEHKDGTPLFELTVLQAIDQIEYFQEIIFEDFGIK